jgi:trk system potassium uptake protein TrkA
MRVAIIGATSMAVQAARLLIQRRHDVIVVDRDRDRLDQLAEEVDCGFVHGDGSKPAILKELAPETVDVLLCLSNDDQDNILAALVGRSLGFTRVVPKITDPEYQHICAELGLEDTIVPDATVARLLADLTEGRDILELSTMIRGNVRFFVFVCAEGRTVGDLDLPARTRPILVYRDDAPILPEPDTRLKEGDEIVLLTEADALSSLRERFADQKGRRVG